MPRQTQRAKWNLLIYLNKKYVTKKTVDNWSGIDPDWNHLPHVSRVSEGGAVRNILLVYLKQFRICR